MAPEKSQLKRGIFPYPGSKARHSEWICSYLPEHARYVEPFGGSAGVLFNKALSDIEVYNDSNGDLVHFFETLRDKEDELSEWLENTPYSEELYHRFADSYYSGERKDSDIERAGRFFFLRYSQFGGKIDDKAGMARSNTSHIRVHRPKQYRSKLAALNAFADRLSEVEMVNRDAIDVIASYDHPKALFYCDPPYIGTESYYGDEFDHERLAETLLEAEGQWILSYDSVPEWYDRDDVMVVERDSLRMMDNSGENARTNERLIMNYNPGEMPSFSEANQSALSSYGDV